MPQSKQGIFLTGHFWFHMGFWGPVGLILHPPWVNISLSTLFIAMRSGILGWAIVCLVYILWKIDCRWHQAVKLDRKDGKIILIFGIFLWLALFSTCQMILFANDEVNSFDCNHDGHS